MQKTIAGFNELQRFYFFTPMSELKKCRGKNRVCGPYTTTRKLITGSHPGKTFYLDSDFQPFNRWTWADNVADTRIHHTGWYCDEYQDSKIRGIVVNLPHSKFLAGWSMGEGMISEIDGTVYLDEREAAWAADSLAEQVAEKERECQEEQEAIRIEEERRLDECLGSDEEEY